MVSMGKKGEGEEAGMLLHLPVCPDSRKRGEARPLRKKEEWTLRHFVSGTGRRTSTQSVSQSFLVALLLLSAATDNSLIVPPCVHQHCSAYGQPPLAPLPCLRYAWPSSAPVLPPSTQQPASSPRPHSSPKTLPASQSTCSSAYPYPTDSCAGV